MATLGLPRNKLTGPIPAEIGNLDGLTHLNLEANALSGPIPPELGNLASLRSLRLGGNNLSGPIPPEFGELATLASLRLDRNQLSGPIPPALVGLASLETLTLDRNELSGPIPPELGNMERLRVLSLDRNDLAGPIPSELGSLSSIETLSFEWNDLTGPIPSELGNLQTLRRLNLRSNALTGPIPPELSNLTDLEYLNLLYAGIAGELCVPDHSGLTSWLAGFTVAASATRGLDFLPCERERPTPGPGPSVRVLYAFPADGEFRQEYADGVRRAMELLQWWFADRLGGPTFALHEPEPQPCQLAEPEAFYIEDAWVRVLHGVQRCAPVGYSGDDFIWVVYADVWDYDPLEVVLETLRNCEGGRLGAGATGITMMGGWDLYGLVTSRFRQCGYYTGIDRWIGGTAHELGHALGLSHPPGCGEGTVETCDLHAVMASGYGEWPHAHLREEDKAILLASPFIR